MVIRVIEDRKGDHIRICLEHDVQARYNHWDDVFIPHRAIPTCDLDEVDLGVELLGKRLEAPIIISSMTGGSKEAGRYNELLARAASEFGLAMGVGSQRAALENPRYRDSYSVVAEYDIPLVLGNLGAPQLSRGNEGNNYGKEEVERAIDMIGAHGIFVHLNYLQEVVQPEGDTTVRGFIENLEALCRDFDVIAKETGAGISGTDALLLKDTGVKALDVGGMSGTSFSAVESFRKDDTGFTERSGRTLREWGIPSPVSLVEANVGLPLIGSGGIRNGLDVARALSLGATAAGMAHHLLEQASKGYEELAKEIEYIIREVRSVLFLSGATCVRDMWDTSPIITGRTADYMK